MKGNLATHNQRHKAVFNSIRSNLARNSFQPLQLEHHKLEMRFGMLSFMRRLFARVPVRTPSEWLDAGNEEIYRNMKALGLSNFDGYGVCIFQSESECRRNLYAAFNAITSFNYGRGIHSINEVYDYAEQQAKPQF